MISGRKQEKKKDHLKIFCNGKDAAVQGN